ncbi:NUDIX domain-containing protein (plasmid) [Nonomuraea sp. CA-143628]|uniref:NUDIX domain-containing protein n=1 Tax=Nonomuraea sp. CA-143628 TaxID=3239997 RepID=UPI003D8BA683
MISAPDQIGVDIAYDDPPIRTYTHPEVLAAIARGEKWADPCMDPALITDWPARQAAAAIPFKVVDGRPVNPHTPTGIERGRNELGHWGEQLCADAIVTAFTEDGRWLVMVERGDGHGWALPGGTVERGERPEVGALRELREETGLALGRVLWHVLPALYVPDPRASDEAWMVTVPVRTHLGTVRHAELPAVTGADDAKRAAWVRADSYAILTGYLTETYAGRVFIAHEAMLAELLG